MREACCVIVELSPDPSRAPSEVLQILLIGYLVSENGGEPTGENISEKDLPGGVTFFQGAHALRVRPVAKRYGTDPDAFEQRGRELGGSPEACGDKAIRFLPFPHIPVTYVLWKQDAPVGDATSKKNFPVVNKFAPSCGRLIQSAFSPCVMLCKQG